MCSQPRASYLGFDLMSKGVSNVSLAFLSGVFPGRVRVVAGDSLHTLPAEVTRRRDGDTDALPCDIVSIDGDSEHASR